MKQRLSRIVRRKPILTLVLGAAAFATVFAFAASLAVNSDYLGAGSDTVASCDTDGVKTAYGTIYSASTPTGYKVTTVTVSEIGPNTQTAPITNDVCAGNTMKVTLTGENNASLAEKTVMLTSPGTGSDAQAIFTADNVAASLVTGVHVVITGP
jgi:hypothetical protein